MYKKGEGVAPDYAQAKYWYEEVIKNDNEFSNPYYSLAYLYYYGNGVEKNLNKACENIIKNGVYIFPITSLKYQQKAGIFKFNKEKYNYISIITLYTMEYYFF